MEYEKLKLIDRDNAIMRTIPMGLELDPRFTSQYPQFSDVIVFGDDYWRSNEGIAKFIDDFVNPLNERDISKFFNEIVFRICTDPLMDDAGYRKQLAPSYKRLFESYVKLFKHPDSLSDWAENKATYIWFEFILTRKRQEQYKKILKKQDDLALKEISDKVKNVYGFSDLEIIYLQYFCSQSKLDELDASLNTCLYIWSKEKCTGKTTVSEYICSFLNGENGKKADEHKSELSREMQIGRFDMPVAMTSRCTILDEAGFHDMTRTYNKFKSMITSNTCNVEYKYKNSKKPKRCYRNYMMSSNNDPIYFVKDEDERRILPIHFTAPKKMSFDDLTVMWHNFVLECNLPCGRLEDLYHTTIKPNSQVGESSYIMLELIDIFSPERIFGCNNQLSYFSVSNVMTFPEVVTQKMSREIVKNVLIRLYGEPDKSQRFYKTNRVKEFDFKVIADVATIINGAASIKNENELPF